MGLADHCENRFPGRFGSAAVILTDSTPMAALGRKADPRPGECLLSPIPDVQTGEICPIFKSALGQKWSVNRGVS